MSDELLITILINIVGRVSSITSSMHTHHSVPDADNVIAKTQQFKITLSRDRDCYNNTWTPDLQYYVASSDTDLLQDMISRT